MSPISVLSLSFLAFSLLSTPQGVAPGGQQSPLVPRRVPGQCGFVGASHAMSFTPGVLTENFLVTTGDPDTRRFIVYVPSSYQANGDPYPVVYMFHGTSQNASSPIVRLNWDEAAEALDFIAVFPEAMPYLLLDGTTRTKWATDSVAQFQVDPSELPLVDDSLFVRELHNTVGAHLNIDCDRVYASGFSNGGAFVKSNIRVDMGDIFAATSSAGGLGTRLDFPGQYYPSNGIDFRPHFEVVGNRDANKVDNCVLVGDLVPPTNLPMAMADITTTPCMWDNLIAMAGEVGMDPAQYTSIEQANGTEILWDIDAFPASVPREYRFRILRNLTHEYPSGNNYAIDYVPIFYEWMMQHRR